MTSNSSNGVAKSRWSARIGNALGSSEAKGTYQVVGANVMAQGMVFAATPLLTRIYRPEHFATFEVFYSLAGPLAILLHGRYTLALMLPKSDDLANRVMHGALLLVGVLTLLATVVSSAWADQIGGSFGLDSTWVLWIGPAAGVLAVRQLVTFFLARHRDFKVVAANRVKLSTLMVGLQLSGGVSAALSYMLTAGRIAADAATTTFLFFHVLPRVKATVFSFRASVHALVRYKKFPLLLAWTGVLSDTQLPVLLLAYRFPAESVGYFALAKLLLLAPTTLTAEALATVFYRSVMDEVHASGRGLRTTIKAFLALTAASLLIFVPVYFLLPYFEFFFGSNWGAAAAVCVPLFPVAFARFAIGPLSKTLSALERQAHLLTWQVGTTAVSMTALWIASDSGDLVTSLWAYSMALLASYVVLLPLCLTLRHRRP